MTAMIQNIERRQQASKEKNHEIWTYPICCGLRTADWLCNSTRKKRHERFLSRGSEINFGGSDHQPVAGCGRTRAW